MANSKQQTEDSKYQTVNFPNIPGIPNTPEKCQFGVTGQLKISGIPGKSRIRLFCNMSRVSLKSWICWPQSRLKTSPWAAALVLQLLATLKRLVVPPKLDLTGPYPPQSCCYTMVLGPLALGPDSISRWFRGPGFWSPGHRFHNSTHAPFPPWLWGPVPTWKNTWHLKKTEKH